MSDTFILDEALSIPHVEVVPSFSLVISSLIFNLLTRMTRNYLTAEQDLIPAAIAVNATFDEVGAPKFTAVRNVVTPILPLQKAHTCKI